MLGVGAALQEIADELIACGVPAVLDARDLNPPAAWVTAQSGTFEYLAGDDPFTLTAQIFLVGRDIGTRPSLDQLSDMLALIADPLRIHDFAATSLILPNHGADPLPAFSFTLETRITET